MAASGPKQTCHLALPMSAFGGKADECFSASRRRQQRLHDGLQLADRDLHFHDLRGTAATRFYTADIGVRAIAEIMAWDEDHVERIIRRYVDRSAATKALIEQLNERRT